MIRENILIGSDRFFNIRSFQSKYFTMPRHLHAEYELVWIDRGFGKKSIGEVIKPFTDGDLTLIGPDCPHLFIADDAYYADNALRCHWRVIQFSKSIFPTAMTELELFNRSTRCSRAANTGSTSARGPRRASVPGTTASRRPGDSAN